MSAPSSPILWHAAQFLEYTSLPASGRPGAAENPARRLAMSLFIASSGGGSLAVSFLRRASQSVGLELFRRVLML